MAQNPKLEDMGSDILLSNCLTGEFGEGQKITVVDHVNGLQHSCAKSDSFMVDMETDNNSRIKKKLQRNLSRNGEKKVGSNERDVSMLATSPRATFHGGSMPEKPTVVAPGSHDRPISPQVHHQITITNGSISSRAAAESKSGGKRASFWRLNINPRRIFFFFATLSCMGTILLIYFTLSMGEALIN